MPLLSDKRIGLAIGIVAFLYAQPTDAGFIAAVPGDGLLSVGSLEASHSSGGTDKAPPREADDSPPFLALTILPQPWDAPSTGMGSGASNGGPIATAFAVADTHECSSGQIVTYLVAQPGVRVPVPFLSGVFRPPRA